MEIAGFVVALLAVVMAGASAVFARGANVRASEANRTAERALDLQARLDDREREFREVRWKGEYDLNEARQPLFRLTNVGMTHARSVTLVVAVPGKPNSAYALGDIDSGASADLLVGEDPMDRDAIELMLFTDDPWRVHWSSPLGHADTYRHVGRQVF